MTRTSVTVVAVSTFLLGLATGSVMFGSTALAAPAPAPAPAAAANPDPVHADAGTAAPLERGHVTGVGGVFFKAKDPKSLEAWYVQNLGMPNAAYGHVFAWRAADAPDQVGHTVWSAFRETTTYFGPASSRAMINYRVDDLDAVLARLKKAGATVDPKQVSDFNGRFGWATDPEGMRFELWEPKAGY